MPTPFERSVFVNCPFDPNYRLLLRSIIFTVLYLRLEPRTAFERADSGEPRLTKIIQLIKGSRFGIHDLSRCKAKKKGEMFRLNMPLELGIDYGCRQYCGGKHRRKKFLILETERYRYQEAISDLSGCDIKKHEDKPKLLIRVVRDWLVQEANAIPCAASKIERAYWNFISDLSDTYRLNGYTPDEINTLSMHELQQQMKLWLREHVE